MTDLLKCLIICALLGLSGPALADHERHVIAVGKGHKTNDFYALPEARVLVDRPGHDVSLILLDKGEIHWKIETSAGTIISEIIRSGPDTGDSRISLSGIPVSSIEMAGLPMVFRPWGRDFRILLNTLSDKLDLDRLSSFQGVHQAGRTPLKIVSVDLQTAGLARDYLSMLTSPSSDLPSKIRGWPALPDGAADYELDFDSTGITLRAAGATRRFAVTDTVPGILLPVTGVYDSTSQKIYCMTYGAEGYLYAVDVQSGKWAVVSSLGGYDAAGLLYDPDSRRLVTTGAFSRPGEIRIYGLDGSHVSLFVPTTAFPGLTDLFDFGNEHGPPLTPRALSEGWLLLQARIEAGGALPGRSQFRTYAVEIATGEVRLLDFGNG